MPRVALQTIPIPLAPRAGARAAIATLTPGVLPRGNAQWQLNRAPYHHLLPPFTPERAAELELGAAVPAFQGAPAAAAAGAPATVTRIRPGASVDYGEQVTYDLVIDASGIAQGFYNAVSTPAIAWPFELVSVQLVSYRQNLSLTGLQWQLFLVNEPLATFNLIAEDVPGEPIIQLRTNIDGIPYTYINRVVFGMPYSLIGATLDQAHAQMHPMPIGRRFYESGKRLSFCIGNVGSSAVNVTAGLLVTLRELVAATAPRIQSAPRPRAAPLEPQEPSAPARRPPRPPPVIAPAPSPRPLIGFVVEDEPKNYTIFGQQVFATPTIGYPKTYKATRVVRTGFETVPFHP